MKQSLPPLLAHKKWPDGLLPVRPFTG